MLIGAAGGLAGTVAMNYAQRVWTRAAGAVPPDSAGGKHDARDWQERGEGRNANELAAQAMATAIAGRRLTRTQLEIAAPLVHYSFGALLGALYGGAHLRCTRFSLRSGVAFGAAVWLLADEIAMPTIKLSQPTTERPVEMHLQSFAAHIVYGTVAEFARSRLAHRSRSRRFDAHIQPFNRPAF
jgi:hypothetical protein